MKLTNIQRIDHSDDVLWKLFRPSHVKESNWENFQEFLALDDFKRWSRLELHNRNKKTHDSISKHTRGSFFFFVNHAKRLVRSIFTLITVFYL